MGNLFCKHSHTEQKCNLLSHNHDFERQLQVNTEEIEKLKNILNNFNNDTSKSLQLIEKDIKILAHKMNMREHYNNSLDLYSNTSNLGNLNMTGNFANNNLSQTDLFQSVEE